MPLYVLLIYAVAFVYAGFRGLAGKEKQFFWTGLTLKVLCTLGFVIVYKVVFQGGDTFGYYKNGTVFYEAILNEPRKAWTLFFWQKGDISFWMSDLVNSMNLYASISTGTIVQIAGIIGLATFNNFYCTSLLFGFFSFAGMWAYYRVFADMFPEIKTQIFAATLLIPSVAFWSAGILKDSITLGCTGFMIYGFYHLFIKKDRPLLGGILLILSFYFIWRIKFYIAVCMIPALAIWFFFHHLNYLRGRTFKVFTTAMTLGVIIVGAVAFAPQLQSGLSRGLELFINKSIDFQSWHGLINSQGASGYSLGDIEFSAWGIISKMPLAIFTCYFRPLIHETTSAISLLSSIENTLLLLFTLFIVFRTGLFRSIKLLFSNHIIFALFVFVMLFGFITGFTSYNFGAMVRYRIPCMPAFLLILFLLRYYANGLGVPAQVHLPTSR